MRDSNVNPGKGKELLIDRFLRQRLLLNRSRRQRRNKLNQRAFTKRRQTSLLGVLPVARVELGPEIVVGDIRGRVPDPRLAIAALELAPRPHAAEAGEAVHGDQLEH